MKASFASSFAPSASRDDPLGVQITSRSRPSTCATRRPALRPRPGAGWLRGAQRRAVRLFGRRRDALKVLSRRHGHVPVYKRLDRGTFQVPEAPSASARSRVRRRELEACSMASTSRLRRVASRASPRTRRAHKVRSFCAVTLCGSTSALAVTNEDAVPETTQPSSEEEALRRRVADSRRRLVVPRHPLEDPSRARANHSGARQAPASVRAAQGAARALASAHLPRQGRAHRYAAAELEFAATKAKLDALVKELVTTASLSATPIPRATTPSRAESPPVGAICVTSTCPKSVSRFSTRRSKGPPSASASRRATSSATAAAGRCASSSRAPRTSAPPTSSRSTRPSSTTADSSRRRLSRTSSPRSTASECRSTASPKRSRAKASRSTTAPCAATPSTSARASPASSRPARRRRWPRPSACPPTPPASPSSPRVCPTANASRSQGHFFVVLADQDHVFFEYQPKHTSEAVARCSGGLAATSRPMHTASTTRSFVATHARSQTTTS